jgi:hypothetical protein
MSPAFFAKIGPIKEKTTEKHKNIINFQLLICFSAEKNLQAESLKEREKDILKRYLSINDKIPLSHGKGWSFIISLFLQKK